MSCEWFEKLLKNNNINIKYISDKHANFRSDKQLFLFYKENNIKTISFIRHPAEWYKSHWELKNNKGEGLFEINSNWHPTWDIDNECYCNNFDNFIKNCINKFPSFLSYLYDDYLRVPPVNELDYIILTKELEEKIPIIFKENNIKSELNYIKNINSFKDNNILYNKNLLQELLDNEKRCINRFNFTTDLNDLKYLIRG